MVQRTVSAIAVAIGTILSVCIGILAFVFLTRRSLAQVEKRDLSDRKVQISAQPVYRPARTASLRTATDLGQVMTKRVFEQSESSDNFPRALRRFPGKCQARARCLAHLFPNALWNAGAA